MFAAARRELLVGVGQQIDVQVRPGRIPWVRERAAGGDVDRVDAGVHQPPAHLRRLLDGVAGLLVLQHEQRVVVIGRADLHLQVEIAPDAGPDRPDDVEDETRAVLERPAVLVGAVVDRRAEKLRDQIAVGAVQLHAVEARVARAPRPLGERGHDLGDVGDGHAVALEAVKRILLVRGALPFRVGQVRHVALPPAVTELQDVPTIVLVHGLAERAPEGDAIVMVDGGVVRDDAATRVHRHERGDDGADAAARELELPVDPHLRAGAVVVVESARDVRPEDPVLDGEIPEVQRLEDDV